MKFKSLHVRSFLLLLFIGAAWQTQAQVMTACNDPEGGIQIWFNYNLNCPSSPGSLAGKPEIGFHSGANGWAKVVEWNGSNAVHGVNIGNDTFVVDLPDPNAYYGITVTAINFVFNQGATNPAEPWGSEGKADNGAGGCNDFYLEMASITQVCPTISAAKDLLLDKTLKITPNPVFDVAVISFENNAQENYNIRITDVAGQLVKEIREFSGNEFLFHKDGQASGFYLVTLTNQKGQSVSSQMVVR